jgi:hypothetical protein
MMPPPVGTSPILAIPGLGLLSPADAVGEVAAAGGVAGGATSGWLQSARGGGFVDAAPVAGAAAWPALAWSHMALRPAITATMPAAAPAAAPRKTRRVAESSRRGWLR